MSSSRQPLRILQVNSAFSGGGADNQTLELTTGLHELGENVTLAIPEASRWESLARERGLTIETFPQRSPLRTALIRRLIAISYSRRVQIIHAHQGQDYWPAVIAARLTGRAHVVVTRHLMTKPAGFSRWFLLPMANVVAVSKAVEGVLRSEMRGPNSRIHQLYNGIDIARFHSGPTAAAREFRKQRGWPDDAVVFGVVAVFHPPRGKGQLEFLEAAGRLKKDFPSARFVLVGAGPEDAMLREAISGLGLEKVASILPFTNDVPLVMNALDVLVHPAVGTEALPTVVFEALASGKPVIASRLNGIPETFIENEHGLLAPPGDAASLADAMAAMLKEPAMRLKFGAAGPAFVRENFSREAMAKRLLNLYKKLCGVD